jgi:NAD(P)H-hydrate epimerase
MAEMSFTTVDGQDVGSVTAEEMRAVDRVAVEDIGLALLQMMENAGRTLAWHVRDSGDGGPVVDALIGNGLTGAVRPPATEHIGWMNVQPTPVLVVSCSAITRTSTG